MPRPLVFHCYYKAHVFILGFYIFYLHSDVFYEISLHVLKAGLIQKNSIPNYKINCWFTGLYLFHEITD